MTKVLKQCPGRDGRRIDFKDKEIFYYQYSPMLSVYEREAVFVVAA